MREFNLRVTYFTYRSKIMQGRNLAACCVKCSLLSKWASEPSNLFRFHFFLNLFAYNSAHFRRWEDAGLITSVLVDDKFYYFSPFLYDKKGNFNRVLDFFVHNFSLVRNTQSWTHYCSYLLQIISMCTLW